MNTKNKVLEYLFEMIDFKDQPELSELTTEEFSNGVIYNDKNFDEMWSFFTNKKNRDLLEKVIQKAVEYNVDRHEMTYALSLIDEELVEFFEKERDIYARENNL
jgi:hypothetical protein